jgi:hypothetical protein
MTDDGRFIALARFESEEAARRNSDRPEQDKWWTETAKLFTGEATFKDSSDVVVDVIGNPDDAGKVGAHNRRGRPGSPGRIAVRGRDNVAVLRPYEAASGSRVAPRGRPRRGS